jgi:L-rhamnose mutarotase
MIEVRRVATVIRLRPEAEAEYRRLHADVWPAVLRAIHECNIRNYSIFLRDGLLFSYYEYVGDDLAADLAKLAQDKETQRWWTFTDPLQQPVETAAPGEWWAPAEELFHTD